MVQEVQTQWNRYQTPNRIQWIWISERKVSDHSQVRDKKTNMAVLQTTAIYLMENVEEFAFEWTYESTDNIYYKIVWGDLYLPQRWAYLVEFYPCDSYGSARYYTMKLYADNEVVYQQRLLLSDHEMRKTTLNLGKKNKLRVSLTAEYDAGTNVRTKFRFIKL